MIKMRTMAALGLLVGLGFSAQASRADQPPAAPANFYNGGTIVNSYSAGSCSSCAAGQAAAGAQPKKGAFEKMKGFFNGPSCGCLANTDISCSNWKQEYQFIFGSCRNFFGNPCFKTPEQLLSISEGEYLGRTNPGLNRINRTYP
jgi:hypothetical protein